MHAYCSFLTHVKLANIEVPGGTIMTSIATDILNTVGLPKDTQECNKFKKLRIPLIMSEVVSECGLEPPATS